MQKKPKFSRNCKLLPLNVFPINVVTSPTSLPCIGSSHCSDSYYDVGCFDGWGSAAGWNCWCWSCGSCCWGGCDDFCHWSSHGGPAQGLVGCPWCWHGKGNQEHPLLTTYRIFFKSFKINAEINRHFYILGLNDKLHFK